MSAKTGGTKLGPIQKGKLADLAWERLETTADDPDEPHHFLFRTEGSVDLLYCRWSKTEDWEFDGSIEGLGLSWSRKRIDLINRGEDPTEDELCEWRRATCRRLAAGSDWCSFAWIVPLWIDKSIQGYALFTMDQDDDACPILEGIFGSVEAAKVQLAVEGAIAETG